jgi:hypothetical protein
MVAGVVNWLPARRLVVLSHVCCVGLTGRWEMVPWRQLPRRRAGLRLNFLGIRQVAHLVIFFMTGALVTGGWTSW